LKAVASNEECLDSIPQSVIIVQTKPTKDEEFTFRIANVSHLEVRIGCLWRRVCSTV